MSDASQQAQAEWEIGQQLASSTLGTVVEIDWPSKTAHVSIGGIVKHLPWVGPAPAPRATVRVSTLGTTTYCQAVEGAGVGTVVSLTESLITVLGDDGETYAYQYNYDVDFLTGDRVILDHARQIVPLRLSTTPEPPEEQPGGGGAPPAQPTRISRDFLPIWSGSWWSGIFTGGTVNIGSATTGAYGYGASIRDTIPNSAVVEAASLRLDQTSDRLPNQPSLMGTHGSDGRPGNLTNAGINGAWQIAGGSHEVNINGEFIGRLIRGEAFGVAFRSGQSWRSYGASPSGRIHVQWLQ